MEKFTHIFVNTIYELMTARQRLNFDTKQSERRKSKAKHNQISSLKHYTRSK